MFLSSETFSYKQKSFSYTLNTFHTLYMNNHEQKIYLTSSHAPCCHYRRGNTGICKDYLIGTRVSTISFFEIYLSEHWGDIFVVVFMKKTAKKLQYMKDATSILSFTLCCSKCLLRYLWYQIYNSNFRTNTLCSHACYNSDISIFFSC